MKITKQLCGITGEYYVAAELSRRGYLAAITLRNSDGVDILVGNIDNNKLISIQVKTTQHKQQWILGKKIENEDSENKYYIFVSIPEDDSIQPVYYIVNSIILAKHISAAHKDWLSKPGRAGKKRKDNPVRQFDPRFFDKSELLTWKNLIDIINDK